MSLLREIGRYARLNYKHTHRVYRIADMQTAICHVASKYGGIRRDGYGTMLLNGVVYPNVYGDEDWLPPSIVGRAIAVHSDKIEILTISNKLRIKIRTIKLNCIIDVYSVADKRAFFVNPNNIVLRIGLQSRLTLNRRSASVDA